MTTIAKDVAAKLAVAVVAVAMAFATFAPAQAQTTEELQQMINDLLAQVAQLQSSTGGSSSAGSCESIPASLTIGAENANVTALQNRLIADGQTIPAGATGYFGGQTQAALAGWQAANGVSPAVGYYGPITMAAMDAACVPASTGDDDMMDDDGEMMDEDEDEMEDNSLSGEASLDDMEINSADDDELQEGAEDAPIAEVTLEFTDGDAEVSRIDITVTGGPDETDPWDVFETLQLWVDGDMVAEEAADDEDDYLDEDTGEFRFSGLDLFFAEDEDEDIIIAATLQNSLDGVDDGETWNVQVDALRFFDADGVATTEDTGFDFGSSESFTIDEEGEEDELTAKTSSSDPDAATLQVEDDSKSDWYTVFIFDLDTDDSENDIELNSIKVNVATTGATYSTLVDDAELVIDGTTIDDVTVDATGNEAVLTFDVDGDVVIDAGDRVQAELMLRFESLASLNEGATVQGSIDSLTTSIVDAEGADDLDNTQLGGAATGDAHTLRTTGIDTSPEATSAEVTTGDNAGDDYATFEIEVEVTAFEQDVRISTDFASSTDFDIVDGSGTTVTGTSTPVLTSSADENGGFFEINEGETETLTLQVTFDAENAGAAARLLLNSITFDESGTATNTDDQTQTTLPETDYRTDVVVIVD